jgi:putative transposase
MRIRFTKTQILGFLREAEAGTPVMDLCWNHCFSRSTFRAWKAQYGEELRGGNGRLKQLERENARLRDALAQRASPGNSSSKSARVAGVMPEKLGRTSSLCVTSTLT